ncbi:MAG: extradiol ring-cleavage dioxygenase [Chloroflexi bacterium]|nr:extradiol ring-cleavage dioxygenase [Chloroflexota bacterium]
MEGRNAVARIVAGLGSSHAYTFLDPEQWDSRRQFTRGNYARRYGTEPPERPEVLDETREGNQARYMRIREGLHHLRAEFERLQPDAWVLIGDDQDENYREENLPQFAIYTGEEVISTGRGGADGTRYRCDASLARSLLTGCVEAGFDLASSRRFPNDALISHAHRDILTFLDPEARVPLVPLFVNAIHVPAPSPGRCYQLGQVLRQVMGQQADDKRIALYASGGWSHFTAGYPWPHYQGPHTVGSIATDFDRRLAEQVARGRGSAVCELSSQDLLANGGIELRSWCVLLGALDDLTPDQLVYEPFFRGVMGMAVGYWNLEQTRPEALADLPR